MSARPDPDPDTDTDASIDPIGKGLIACLLDLLGDGDALRDFLPIAPAAPVPAPATFVFIFFFVADDTCPPPPPPPPPITDPFLPEAAFDPGRVVDGVATLVAEAEGNTSLALILLILVNTL